MEIGHQSEPSVGCGGRIFGIFWTAFSSLFLGLGLWLAWGSVEAWKWEAVPCVVERFEIVADANQDPAFRADLVYHYEVDGRKFTGTTLWKDDKGSDDYEDIAEVREQLAVGPEGPLAELSNVAAECRVKPGEPQTSTLMPSGTGGIWGGLAFAMFGGFFVLIGLAMIFGEGKWNSAPAPAVSRKGEENGWVIVILFLFFGCAGLAVMGGLVVPKAVQWLSMRGWNETEAEVIWSRVRSNRSSDGTTYAVDLFYRYEVAGREYRSNRYDLLGGSSSGSKGKHEVVDAHPPGSKLRIFVDPDEPWRAVVKRNPGWWGLFALFPLPFLAVGFGGMGWYLKKRRGGNSVSRPRGGHVAAARASRLGPQPLKTGEWVRAGGSRSGAFIGLLVFALFWNGFLIFFQRSLWGDFTGGPGVLIGGFFTLFMVPFFLVGIGVACGALYAFAALFAPRYEIQLAGDDLKPGRPARVQWRRAGGRGDPRDFALVLVGREEATYSQGSSSSTARSIFREEVLFETTVPQAMAAGGVSLRIPDSAVPTFRGEHNRIVWLLCLHAKVPRFPDLREEREIIVQPLDASELP